MLMVLGIATLLLDSCKLAKPYKRPDHIAPDQLFRDHQVSDSNTIATISWSNMFQDSLLQSLIRKGIENNTDLAIAVARIKKAAAGFKQSKQALQPTLNVTASPVFQNIPPSLGVPQTYELVAGSSWEADIWGKLNSAKRAALLTLLQSEAYKRAVQTQLVSDIATNYYLLMAYDAQLEITEKTLALRKEEVETMKVLKESDVVTGASVAQSIANRYSVEITIPDLKQQIRETENTISLLLGNPPDSILRSSLKQQVMTPELKTGVPSQLLANRPDVQEAELQLRNALELVNVAHAYFYPSLNITASSGFVSTGISQLLSPNSFYATLSGILLQPIFDQGINRQRLSIAIANSDEYLAAFRKSMLTAGQEVSNALYSYKSASEKEALRLQQIAYLQKSVDFTKELLNYSSKANYTDVLTSEQSLLAAQLNSIADQLQQLTAAVSLYRSLGGGWK